jgi:hypothetical protein
MIGVPSVFHHDFPSEEFHLSDWIRCSKGRECVYSRATKIDLMLCWLIMLLRVMMRSRDCCGLCFLTVHRLTGVPVSCLHGGTLPKSSKQQQQEIDYDFSNQSYYSNYMEIKHRMDFHPLGTQLTNSTVEFHQIEALNS